GLKPVVAIYSTFLQRAYDQLIHDVVVQNLPVLFAIDRAGPVGADGPTHNGSYDISFMRCLPNIVIMTPADENECRQMLYTGIQVDGPASVRYPRGGGPGVEVEKEMTALPIAKAEIRSQGKRIAILAFGVVLEFAQAAADELGATVVNMRFVKPIDEELILKMAATHDLIVTVEENVVQGGAGEAVNQVLVENGVVQAIVNYGLPDRLIQHGSRDDMLDDVGMNKEGLMQFIRHHLGEHEQSAKIKSV
ncbi:MAG: transketolase C-terminal domain-containing protein, partial [Gammaproteobacteria bacterium]